MELTLTAVETAIKDFLDNLAKEDASFANTYKKQKKSLKECCQYIYGEVGKARNGKEMCVALPKEEVYGLAIHYYDEDDITIANNVIKPTAASASTLATTAVAALTAEQPHQEKPKARKPRKPKASVVVAEEDPNVPEPFDMPLF